MNRLLKLATATTQSALGEVSLIQNTSALGTLTEDILENAQAVHDDLLEALNDAEEEADEDLSGEDLIAFEVESTRAYDALDALDNLAAKEEASLDAAIDQEIAEVTVLSVLRAYTGAEPQDVSQFADPYCPVWAVQATIRGDVHHFLVPTSLVVADIEEAEFTVWPPTVNRLYR